MLGNPDAAIAMVHQLLKDSPNYTRGLRLKAALQIATNNHPGGIETYKKILTLQPEDTLALNQLAEILIDLRLYSQAQSYLTELLIGQSNNVKARYRRLTNQ